MHQRVRFGNKRPLTILETMVVISLIALVMGVLGYNMKGVLEKGKAFRTEQAIERLQNVFQMAAAEGVPYNEIKEQLSHYVQTYGMVKNPKEFLKDGWGEPFTIEILYSGKEVKIVSSRLIAYKNDQKSPTKS